MLDGVQLVAKTHLPPAPHAHVHDAHCGKVHVGHLWHVAAGGSGRTHGFAVGALEPLAAADTQCASLPIMHHFRSDHASRGLSLAPHRHTKMLRNIAQMLLQES